MNGPLPRRIRAGLAAVVAVALAVIGLHAVVGGPKQKTAIAYFPEAIHVYPGSDVDVLGVRIGSVKSVTPQGPQVKVVLSYDASQRLPADVSAVVLAPTLVADRVVQLAPVYSHGPALGDGQTIPIQRTEVPVELDQLNRNLYELTQALGPNGANRHGALSRAIAVGARNLRGQGAKANETLRQVSELTQTLSSNRGALVATIDNLNAFTATLAADDQSTRRFTTELDQVSAELAGERSDFSAALSNLQVALAEVTTFLHHNRHLLTSDVRGLATVSTVLARERTLLGHMVDMGAVGISNYPHMYTPSQRTYNARFDFNSVSDNPEVWVCQLLGSLGSDPKQCLAKLRLLAAQTDGHTAKAGRR
jgi:phospholipid/cholesterol/gamma-HCH transport system substrate-binding protein